MGFGRERWPQRGQSGGRSASFGVVADALSIPAQGERCGRQVQLRPETQPAAERGETALRDQSGVSVLG